MALHIVILAAGQGKRMRSSTPKVLHELAGKSMLERVVITAEQLKPEAIHVIYGHAGELLQKKLEFLAVNWVKQEEQLGTGHAVMQALAYIPDTAMVLVLSADVPLIQATTLKHLTAHSEQQADSRALTLLVANVENPQGLGRIIRDDNQKICAIVEEKDATLKQKTIQEIYSGICYAQAADLARWLPKLANSNAQNEYYLTQIIDFAVRENLPVLSCMAPNLMEIQGVNDRLQLQRLERVWQQHLTTELMLQGVSLADATRVDLRGELHCGEDVFIDINTVFKGKVTIAKGSSIGPNCILTNVTIGENCQILANSILENSELANDCRIGPFARLRPGTILASGCKIGNFVETKNACFGENSKASHLSYLGDVSLGREVNIGAGTITCNYDGANKHQTVIGDHVFIGSDTQLIAPVTIGASATIGAGSTIRKNAPEGQLTLTESKQKTIVGWKRAVKKESC